MAWRQGHGALQSPGVESETEEQIVTMPVVYEIFQSGSEPFFLQIS